MGKVKNDAFGGPVEMIDDGVASAPTSRKFPGASGQGQRLLVNFELVMSEQSVPGLTKPLDKVSDKVSDKGSKRRLLNAKKCPNSRLGQDARATV